ncbi:uncharacterized protein B0P05DRAFT_575743 [Gilbertella persicaria]|uniref:uncharacterized protein n=1 Tax=Gilbertella persicaria TaxID=101096 RepID=UPI00221FF0E7|nr:uncharacterized protein B0P05DRAFT_575743 [Gilbertella persicaria]KAI8050635.1 hypothetical protein B0P05DRAFT_575743 [Gilbertella persicaria]
MDTVDQLRQQFQFDDSGLDFFGAQDDIEAEKDVDETQEEEQRLRDYRNSLIDLNSSRIRTLYDQRRDLETSKRSNVMTEEEFNEIASVVELAITRIDSVVNRHPSLFKVSFLT